MSEPNEPIAHQALAKAMETAVRFEQHEKLCGERMGEIRGFFQEIRTDLNKNTEQLHQRLNSAIKDRNDQWSGAKNGLIGLLLGAVAFLLVKMLGWG